LPETKILDTPVGLLRYSYHLDQQENVNSSRNTIRISSVFLTSELVSKEHKILSGELCGFCQSIVPETSALFLKYSEPLVINFEFSEILQLNVSMTPYVFLVFIGDLQREYWT
jgi:hypothetical protein